VGGGGGGGADVTGSNGGGGGGLNGLPAPHGGTQETGGGCLHEADFGIGGQAWDSTMGGSGGGWYGGCDGGGGSGFISPFSKSGSFPGGTNAGEGKVIITT
jgi:hypothetical protein